MQNAKNKNCKIQYSKIQLRKLYDFMSQANLVLFLIISCELEELEHKSILNDANYINNIIGCTLNYSYLATLTYC